MFDFNATDFNRIVIAAVGSLVLTTASVGAAVGSACAFGTAPISYAQVSTADTIAAMV